MTEIEWDYPPETLIRIIKDSSERIKWEKLISNFKILKIYNNYSDLAYCYVKTPFILRDRDLI